MRERSGTRPPLHSDDESPALPDMPLAESSHALRPKPASKPKPPAAPSGLVAFPAVFLAPYYSFSEPPESSTSMSPVSPPAADEPVGSRSAHHFTEPELFELGDKFLLVKAPPRTSMQCAWNGGCGVEIHEPLGANIGKHLADTHGVPTARGETTTCMWHNAAAPEPESGTAQRNSTSSAAGGMCGSTLKVGTLRSHILNTHEKANTGTCRLCGGIIARAERTFMYSHVSGCVSRVARTTDIDAALLAKGVRVVRDAQGAASFEFVDGQPTATASTGTDASTGAPGAPAAMKRPGRRLPTPASAAASSTIVPIPASSSNLSSDTSQADLAATVTTHTSALDAERAEHAKLKHLYRELCKIAQSNARRLQVAEKENAILRASCSPGSETMVRMLAAVHARENRLHAGVDECATNCSCGGARKIAEPLLHHLYPHANISAQQEQELSIPRALSDPDKPAIPFVYSIPSELLEKPDLSIPPEFLEQPDFSLSGFDHGYSALSQPSRGNPCSQDTLRTAASSQTVSAANEHQEQEQEYPPPPALPPSTPSQPQLQPQTQLFSTTTSSTALSSATSSSATSSSTTLSATYDWPVPVHRALSAFADVQSSLNNALYRRAAALGLLYPDADKPVPATPSDAPLDVEFALLQRDTLVALAGIEEPQRTALVRDGPDGGDLTHRQQEAVCALLCALSVKPDAPSTNTPTGGNMDSQDSPTNASTPSSPASERVLGKRRRAILELDDKLDEQAEADEDAPQPRASPKRARRSLP